VGYYKINFSLINHFNWSLADIESLIPFERGIYLLMYLEEAKKKENQAEA